MSDKKFSFDWTVSLNTIILIAGLIGTGFVMEYRLSIVEKNLAQVQARIEKFAEQNNTAHLSIIAAAERVGTKLDEHIKYTVKP